MDMTTIVAISGLLGALGGLFHWLTPDPAGISKADSIRRIVLGAIAGAILGSPTLYGVFLMDNATTTGMVALITAAGGVMAMGYGGIEIKNLITAKKPEEKPLGANTTVGITPAYVPAEEKPVEAVKVEKIEDKKE